jgi:uncharacterized membrane protein YgcG
MRRMGYDARCFASDLLALAVAGRVRIRREDRLLKDDWHLEKTAPPAGGPPEAAQAALLARLFPGGRTELELHKRNAAAVAGAQAAHRKSLSARYQPELFSLNNGSIALAMLIALAFAVLAFGSGGGYGIAMIVVILVLMSIVMLIFRKMVKAPTRAGRELLDEIEGLKLYLSVAERDELASMPGPGTPPALDTGRYEKLLPFAVALDVEEAWTAKFTRAVGAAAAAAAAEHIGWYHGGRVSDLGSLSKSIGSSLSSQIASSSSPPGSSSGSGGGGSSGGGGGGGGGGGR